MNSFVEYRILLHQLRKGCFLKTKQPSYNKNGFSPFSKDVKSKRIFSIKTHELINALNI